jgi:hypothetical protein
MAYVAPPQWAHLDRPTAAKLNIYRDGLDAIHGLTGDSAINIAVAKRMSTVAHYYLINRQRYLLYLGGGRIVDPADVEAAVSLSTSGGWSVYDLLQVSWLFTGRLYQVQDVDCCFEDYVGL